MSDLLFTIAAWAVTLLIYSYGGLIMYEVVWKIAGNRLRWPTVMIALLWPLALLLGGAEFWIIEDEED